jgi:hypothetical protein
MDAPNDRKRSRSEPVSPALKSPPEDDVIIHIRRDKEGKPSGLGHVYGYKGTYPVTLDTNVIKLRTFQNLPHSQITQIEDYKFASGKKTFGFNKGGIKKRRNRCCLNCAQCVVLSIVVLFWVATLLRTLNPYTCDQDTTVRQLVRKPDDQRSILIFGNGPCVKKSARKKLGKRVDEFDEVVRFNNYQLIPELTGSKVTVEFYNGGTVRKHTKHSKDVCSTCLESGGWNGFWAFGLVSRLFVGGGVDLHAKCLPPSLINGLKDKLKYTKLDELWYGPTSGMLAIDFFLQHYPVVHIHGFSFTNLYTGHEHHFYGNSTWKDSISDLFHLPGYEREYVHSLIQAGRVKLLDPEVCP